MKGWTSARIDEIPKAGNGWIPVRDHFGIEAFGVNAWGKRATDGQLIGAHAETDTGHEELYYVFRGHARFTVGDDEIDAPAGTIVFVRDPDVQRSATPVDADTVVLTAGGKPGAAFAVSDWEIGSEWNAKAMSLYTEKRYDEAAAVMREGIAAGADVPGMHYNLACFAALAGETDDALEHLRIACDANDRLAEQAKSDPDFDPIRDDPLFPAA